MAARYYLVTETADVTFGIFREEENLNRKVSRGAARDMDILLNTRFFLLLLEQQGKMVDMDYFISPVSEEELRRERAKARELRQSAWWKRKKAERTCYYCDRKFPPQELTMDHLVPLIRGGKSTKGNVVTSCKECNNKKKHMLPMEWEEYIEKLKEL